MKRIKGYEEYDLSTAYGCITFVKYVLLEDGATLSDVEELGFYSLVHGLRRANVKLATALATVLMAGTFDDGIFSMPATRDCMAEFKNVSKMLAKHQPLYLVDYSFCNTADEVKTYFKCTHNGVYVTEVRRNEKEA